MTGMKLPRPSDKAKELFSGIVPDDPTITLRPMFGNLAAFVNGNMFAGLFGEDLFVRLPEAEAAVIKRRGGRQFEPVAGHAMTGYVIVPTGWQTKLDSVRPHVKRALELTRTMPPKAKKPAAKKAAAALRKKR